MKKIFVFIILTLPWVLIAQSNEGIGFVKGLTWKEVLKKAKREKKYIFIDCFATWCGPCKKMDSEVFSNPEVGKFFNENFINVRLQMDQTKNDNEEVRKWLSIANQFKSQYGIPSYPTYFFFSPEGLLVHRLQGAKQVASFLQSGKDAIDPTYAQRGRFIKYYSLLEQYNKGQRDYTVMAALADTAKLLGQDEIAQSISQEYRSFLLSQNHAAWKTASNVRFMARFLDASNDSFFIFFYRNSRVVDSLLQQEGLAQSVIDRIIQREEIKPTTKPIQGPRASNFVPDKENEPDWKQLITKVSAKYDKEYAERNVLYMRTKWYLDHHMWEQCTNYFIRFVKNFPVTYCDSEMAVFINSICWNGIFKRSVDKEQIDAAIICFESFIKSLKKQYGFISSGLLDTYANMLYKSGQKEKAIQVQTEAIRTDKWGSADLMDALSRMQKGKPTWPHYIDRHDYLGRGLVD